MVTMSTEKSVCRRRKPAERNGVEESSGQSESSGTETIVKPDSTRQEMPAYTSANIIVTSAEDSPNCIVYKKVFSCSN